MKKLFLALLILCFAVPVLGDEYHVCRDGYGEGDTSGSSRVNCMDGFDDLGTPSAGDIYYLYDDDGDYREKLTITQSGGGEGTRITFQPYTGESPVINGSIDYSEAAVGAWTEDDGDYYTSYAQAPPQVFVDGTRLTEVEAKEDLDQNTEW